jgi:hypothetical protein
MSGRVGTDRLIAQAICVRAMAFHLDHRTERFDDRVPAPNEDSVSVVSDFLCRSA